MAIKWPAISIMSHLNGDSTHDWPADDSGYRHRVR
jgi:hypothetical protein